MFSFKRLAFLFFCLSPWTNNTTVWTLKYTFRYRELIYLITQKVNSNILIKTNGLGSGSYQWPNPGADALTDWALRIAVDTALHIVWNDKPVFGVISIDCLGTGMETSMLAKWLYFVRLKVTVGHFFALKTIHFTVNKEFSP